ncbi:MAG TPA: phosphoribosyltransferase family protein [archaeon]|jgi:hypoxanthine phosphoribosyltransferase|nr:phosphoribosyltransferase family protein [archaeon]
MYLVSWNEFESLSMELAKQIMASNKKYFAIITVNRGGLLLGRILSGVLGVPLGIISAKYMTDKKNYIIDKNISFLYDMYGELQGNILLIDDIFEATGNDIKKVIMKNNKKIKYIDLGCVFYKSKDSFKPDFYINQIKHDINIIFPYQEKALLSDLRDSD